MCELHRQYDLPHEMMVRLIHNASTVQSQECAMIVLEYQPGIWSTQLVSQTPERSTLNISPETARELMGTRKVP